VEEKLFVITEAVRNAVLSYLMSRPYSEVAKGVEMLQNLPPLVQDKAPLKAVGEKE
jgi:hypothetical protein